MPEPGKQRLFANTLANAAAQFGTLAIAIPTLTVSRAERDGLIATARSLVMSRETAGR